MITAYILSRIPPFMLRYDLSGDARVYIYIRTFGSHYAEENHYIWW
jgi:hypothetical protein